MSPGQGPGCPSEEAGQDHRQQLIFNQEFRQLDKCVVIRQIQGRAGSLSAVSAAGIMTFEHVCGKKVRSRPPAHGSGSGSVGPMTMVLLGQGLRKLQSLWTGAGGDHR